VVLYKNMEEGCIMRLCLCH